MTNCPLLPATVPRRMHASPHAGPIEGGPEMPSHFAQVCRGLAAIIGRLWAWLVHCAGRSGARISIARNTHPPFTVSASAGGGYDHRRAGVRKVFLQLTCRANRTSSCVNMPGAAAVTIVELALQCSAEGRHRVIGMPNLDHADEPGDRAEPRSAMTPTNFDWIGNLEERDRFDLHLSHLADEDVPRCACARDRDGRARPEVDRSISCWRCRTGSRTRSSRSSSATSSNRVDRDRARRARRHRLEPRELRRHRAALARRAI